MKIHKEDMRSKWGEYYDYVNFREDMKTGLGCLCLRREGVLSERRIGSRYE